MQKRPPLPEQSNKLNIVEGGLFSHSRGTFNSPPLLALGLLVQVPQVDVIVGLEVD